MWLGQVIWQPKCEFPILLAEQSDGPNVFESLSEFAPMASVILIPEPTAEFFPRCWTLGKILLQLLSEPFFQVWVNGPITAPKVGLPAGLTAAIKVVAAAAVKGELIEVFG